MNENKCPCCGSPLDLETHWINSGPWYSCESESCWFQCSEPDLPRIAAAMEAEARHNALVEAVKKMLKADEKWCQSIGSSEETQMEAIDNLSAASAEVDRLIANQDEADCKGEG